MGSHRVFRFFWWATNALLALALLSTLCTGIWEHSVRQYLKGFSDAIIPEDSSQQQKAEAILSWMTYGPPRREAPDPSALSAHDPTDTLNYRQLLEVGALPVLGTVLRRVLDSVLPGWNEAMDWSLLLERRSFAFFFLPVWALIFFLLLRIVLAWLADHRLRIPRLRLRTSLIRATSTFFSTSEIK